MGIRRNNKEEAVALINLCIVIYVSATASFLFEQQMSYLLPGYRFSFRKSIHKSS